LLEGARPTIERVRMKIGRGSPNTVTPYLETWFRSLGARIADPMAFSTPPALPDPISEAAKHFWEAALAAARAECAATLDADRAEFASASRKLDAERAQLQTDRDRINAQLQAKEEASQLLRAHLSESQARVEALLLELAARDRAIVDLRSHVAQLEADRDTAQQHLDAERAVFESLSRKKTLPTASRRWLSRSTLRSGSIDVSPTFTRDQKPQLSGCRRRTPVTQGHWPICRQRPASSSRRTERSTNACRRSYRIRLRNWR
jgi:hypothetical protein